MCGPTLKSEEQVVRELHQSSPPCQRGFGFAKRFDSPLPVHPLTESLRGAPCARGGVSCAAGSRSRRVIARIEHGPKGRNPRFIVTNLEGEANELYERVYCQRGDMENRIKEQQLALFADRTSSTKWWTNQYRVLLAALAYTLLETMRRAALRGTDVARAQCQTIRLRLLRIGAVVILAERAAP